MNKQKTHKEMFPEGCCDDYCPDCYGSEKPKKLEELTDKYNKQVKKMHKLLDKAGLEVCPCTANVKVNKEMVIHLTYLISGLQEEIEKLKEQTYAEGYVQGKKDGAETARIENNL